MPKHPVCAAIYARISSDQDGTSLGVTRQLEDCRALAEKLGWTVAEEYVDNDISAYTVKKRPAYQRMLDDVAAGDRDAVIAYHLDRLTRRPIELEHFVEVATTAKVTVRFVSGGDFDLVSGDGLMLMRMLSAVAAGESATKSRRMKRKNDESAARGVPHKGGNRPFGYEDDWLTARVDEAAVVRAMVERFLAGESLRSIAVWLDAERVKTVNGRPWLSTSVRTMLRNPRYAGLRSHRGDVVGTAVWEPIITVAERDKVMALMDRRASTRERTARSYLLTGLLRCGKCGNRLFSSRREDSRRYVCMGGPDHGGGCGRLTIVATPLEQLIADAVLYRLDTPELAAALTGQAERDTETAAMSEALAQARAHLDELAQIYGDGKVSQREWLTAKAPIDARVKDLERRLARAAGNGALAGIIGNGESLRAQWTDLPLGRQAAIVKTILDHANIGPGTPSARSLDPGRVDLVWRI